jgi:hypothetical protein
MGDRLCKQIVTVVLAHVPFLCNTTVEQREVKAKANVQMLGRRHVALGNKTTTIGNKIITLRKVGNKLGMEIGQQVFGKAKNKAGNKITTFGKVFGKKDRREQGWE